ncbi:elongin-A3 isoform X1 [Lingula anatina]|uniref:Elongin-A3 isoform X1 n=1 Tax=Lingula anatina TaxID=7574 RepID=A0A1S3JY93_LINAN|nr:elongin-A3 isoform X2 [Lingula anatina]XP_013415016.1 elongin-A3 isoform X1 [Lingula anatina]|eukprot:XP_013415015.1 elongin-A3 isoform X2 [Lingula anatina]
MEDVEKQILLLKKYLEKGPAEEKIFKVFRKLEKLPVTLDVLQSTGIGKTVNHLRKHEAVGEQARALVTKWKGFLKATPEEKVDRSPQKDGGDISKVKVKKSDNESHDHRKHKSKSGKGHRKEKASNSSICHEEERKHTSASKLPRECNSEKPENDMEKTSSGDSMQYANGEKDQRKVSSFAGDMPAIADQREKSPCHYDLHTDSKDLQYKKDINSKGTLGKMEPQNNMVNEDLEDNPGMSFEDFLNYDAGAVKRKVSKKSKPLENAEERKNASYLTKPKTDLTNDAKDTVKGSDVAKNSSHLHREHSSDSGHKHSKSKEKRDHKHKSGHSSGHHHDGHSTAKHYHKDGKHKDKSRSVSEGSKSSSHHKERSGSRSEKDGSRSAKHGEKRKADVKMIDVPTPSKQIKLSPGDILATLPEIQPHYKPLPHMELEDENRKKKGEFVDESLIGTKSHSRTQVYSGRKQVYLTEVPTLYNACMKVLIENIDALDYVGGVPYDIMKPVLERCSPTQLYTLEDYNPQFVGETDELWHLHSIRDFKTAKPEEMETWRELYLRLHDEREEKLKKITANISKSMQKATPVRQVKLAYVDVAAKPPREVRRRQMKFGTAGPSKGQNHLAKLTSQGGVPEKHVVPTRHVDTSPVPLGRQQKVVRHVAPMMQKTLRFMKKLSKR